MLTGSQTREGGENHPTSLSTEVYRINLGQKGLSRGARHQVAAGREDGSEHCTFTNHRPKNEVSVGPTVREITRGKTVGVYTCATIGPHLLLTWENCMDLGKLHGCEHGRAACTCPCPCCMSHVHAVYPMSMLGVPCPCCVSMYMLHVHPCPSCVSKSMTHDHVHATCSCHVHDACPCPCPCFISTSMLNVHVHAECPCLCCMSMSICIFIPVLHVHVIATCPCLCCVSMSSVEMDMHP
jgi:hypothetical protein